MVTVSVGLPGVHPNDVVNEALIGTGATVVDVDVDEVVDVVDDVVDVDVVVDGDVDVDVVVDVDVDEVVVVGGSPAIAMPSKTTAQARMPVIASTAWRDLDVGTATPFATQQPQ